MRDSLVELEPDLAEDELLAESEAELDLQHPQYYLNRELSWIQFNARVLHEAIDPRTPLLERLKFMAIFSSNLDEFFMVRVSGLREQAAAGVSRLPPDGRTPHEQLALVADRLPPLVQKQHQHFQQVIRPQLVEEGIHLLDYTDLNAKQRAFLQDYFETQIFPVITPLAVDPGHPFPHISNLSLNLAVIVEDVETSEPHFARIKVPDILPRFVLLPDNLKPRSLKAVWMGVPLEQAIAHHLGQFFPGMKILESCLFRITRDADLAVQEDEAGDLLLAIEEELRKQRLGGSAVRLEVEAQMSDRVRQTLLQQMNLEETDIYTVEGLLCLRDLMPLSNLPLPHLKDPPWQPATPARVRRAVEQDEDWFSLIRRRDLLVQHPYHSFSRTVQAFISQAAHDPDVLAIKMTLYRTSGDSPIVEALIEAAENRKQVAVLIELKARFDEENNILWARKLENAGVHVVYGLVGLKTHTKVLQVVRREVEGIRRYMHIGTGNYNHRTARLYTDLGLFTCRETLGADTTDLFNYLTGYSRQRSYRKLLVAPVNLRDRILELIQRETQQARQGNHARIVAKMNALVDPQLIRSLYEASQAGVQIDLIVRGVCCLRPNVPEISSNIRVISIIGRFLEHSRIFYFHNGGHEDLYIGSADWMPRNFDRRVEVLTPVEDANLVKDIQEILGILLSDNCHAWELQPDGNYQQRQPIAGGAEQSSQVLLMELAAH